MQSKVELQIERLVFRGFVPTDRYSIAKAFELELEKLLTEKGTPQLLSRTANIAQLQVGGFSVELGSKAADTGQRIARQMYGGLNK